MTDGVDRRTMLLSALAGAGIGSTLGSAAPAAALTESDYDYLDEHAVVASTHRFPGIDPTGETDSTDGLQTAIHTAPSGGTVVIPRGRYRIDSRLTIYDGKSAHIVATGATLVQNSANPVLTLLGVYEDVLAVSAVNRVERAYPSGKAFVSTLALSPPPDWRAGDIVKVVADDVLPERRVGNGTIECRVGQFAVIEAVEASQVVLRGVLRDSYTNNVRVTRVTNQTLSLVGGTFETSPDKLDQDLGPIMSFTNLLAPRLTDVHIPRIADMGIQMVSCLGYEIRNARVGAAPDNFSGGQYGYGILDNSCNFGRIIGGTFTHVRHAYTDDTPQVGTNSSVHGYGRTYGTAIIGARASATSAAAFDTHHSSESVHFLGCMASGGVPLGSNSVGFQLRGKRHRVTAGTVEDMAIGVSVINESTSGESWGHWVDGLSVSGAYDCAVVASVHGSNHALSYQRDERENLRLTNTVVRESRRFMTVVNSTVTVEDATFTAVSGESGIYYNGITTTNSKISVDRLVLDYTSNTAGVPRAFVSSSATSASPGIQHSYLNDVEIRANESVASRGNSPFNGPDHYVSGRNVRWTYPFPAMPGYLSEDSSLQWSCDFSTDVARSDLSSGYTFLNASMLAGELFWLSRSIDQYQFVQLNPGGAAIVAQAFPAGKVRGQIINFWQSGTGTWTIRSGDAYRTAMLGGVDCVLSKDTQIRVFWDGSLWRQTG